MPSDNIFKDIIGSIADFFDWAREVLDDDAARKALIEDLGLDPARAKAKPDLPQGSFDSIKNYREQGKPDREAFLSALADIRAIYAALRSFIASLGVGGATLHNELTYRLMDLLLLNYVRLRHPRVHFWAQLLSTLAEDSRELTEEDSIHVSFWRALFKAVQFALSPLYYLPKFFAEGLEDEEEARRASDRVLISAAGFISSVATKDLIYGWDAPKLPESVQKPTTKADEISRRMLTFAFGAAEKDPATGSEVEKQIVFSLAFVPKTHGGSGLFISVGGAGEAVEPAGEKWRAIFKFSSPSAFALQLGGAKFLSGDPPREARISAALETRSDGAAPVYSIPNQDETRIEIGGLSFSGALSAGEAEFKASLKNCALVLAGGDNDGFLAEILPGDTRLGFNFGFGFSTKRGFFTEGDAPLLSGRSTGPGSPGVARPRALTRTATPAIPPDLPTLSGVDNGSPGLQARIPVGKSLGPVTVFHLLLRFDPEAEANVKKIATSLTASLGVKLGPVEARIDQIGFELALTFTEGAGGNLTFADIGLGFKPPTGIGLAINAAIVTGGGFLFYDDQKKQYAGVLVLNLEGGITVKAVGLIATRLPNGAKGFSLLIMITAEDFKPIPLGLGFKLTGIGGLLAVNRTFNEGALRDGIKNQTLDSILFPKDPIHNAPQILNALNTVFPARKGSHLFGPVAQISWGAPTLFTMELGLLFEMGSRLRLIVLGRVSAILPKKENDLLRLNMDAFGVLDFDQGAFSLDAALYDSRLLKKFVLTGGMALRLNWGSSPNFALAVGGFNQSFNAPANFPTLERITIALATGDNPRLTCSAYFAVTSNTVQFGANASLYAAAHGFSIEGEVGFDVLIQLNPFHFLAEFHASIQLKRGSRNLFKVSVEGAFEGPRPLRVKGKATFEILWWDVSISFNKTLVEGERPAPPDAINAFEELKKALSDARNWGGELPAGERRMVSLREVTLPNDHVAIHPLGSVSVKQTVAPLNLVCDIDKFGDATPSGPRRFAITSVTLGGQPQTPKPLTDFFAPAQFFEMSDDQKISSPSYVRMEAGLMFSSDSFVFNEGDKQVSPLTYETFTIDKAAPAPLPKKQYDLPYARLFEQARFGAAAMSQARRTGKAQYQNREQAAAVTLVKQGWVIASTGDLSPLPIPGAGDGKSLTWSECQRLLQKFNRENPGEARKRQIVPSFEITR
jgi:Family of unknown function (DUF6603)